MTTSVKITAHCPSTKVAVVTVRNGHTEVETKVLQDGESTEFYVYDARVISVKEELKAAK